MNLHFEERVDGRNNVEFLRFHSRQSVLGFGFLFLKFWRVPLISNT